MQAQSGKMTQNELRWWWWWWWCGPPNVWYIQGLNIIRTKEISLWHTHKDIWLLFPNCIFAEDVNLRTKQANISQGRPQSWILPWRSCAETGDALMDSSFTTFSGNYLYDVVPTTHRVAVRIYSWIPSGVWGSPFKTFSLKLGPYLSNWYWYMGANLNIQTTSNIELFKLKVGVGIHLGDFNLPEV